MKRGIILIVCFSLIIISAYAQVNKSTISIGASYSFPFNENYKYGIGGLFQYNYFVSEKLSLNAKLSYTSFKNDFFKGLNISYLIFKPGVNLFLSEHFYLQAGVGPRIVRRVRDFSVVNSEKIYLLDGVVISSGVGYRRINKSGHGYDFFANFNSGAAKRYVPTWVSVGIAYTFRVL